MILIVDDDQALAENCSMFLESSGYDVDVALSANEALSKIKSKQPALLISDCCMPDLTGVQLSTQLKTKSGGAPFPILLMSGWRQCQVAPGKSYDAFIRKPFLAENLLIQVQKLMNAKGITLPANTKELL
jgi:CheY-like chemotaxis protein